MYTGKKMIYAGDGNVVYIDVEVDDDGDVILDNNDGTSDKN